MKKTRKPVAILLALMMLLTLAPMPFAADAHAMCVAEEKYLFEEKSLLETTKMRLENGITDVEEAANMLVPLESELQRLKSQKAEIEYWNNMLALCTGLAIEDVVEYLKADPTFPGPADITTESLVKTIEAFLGPISLQDQADPIRMRLVAFLDAEIVPNIAPIEKPIESLKSVLFSKTLGKSASEYLADATTQLSKTKDDIVWVDATLHELYRRHEADPDQNTIALPSGAILAGESFTFSATGHRQDAAECIAKNFRYIPVQASVNATVDFSEKNGTYTAQMTIAGPGDYTLSVRYQLQRWDDGIWQSIPGIDIKSTTVTVTPAASTTAVGDTAVTTSPDKKPVDNGDGTYTLPGGGTVVIGGDDGMKIDAPAGTIVDGTGGVIIPDGKKSEITLPYATIALPGGSTIDSSGTVTVGNDIATATLSGGTEITLPQDSVISGNRVIVGAGGAMIMAGGRTISVREAAIIIFDENTLLGYSLENLFLDVSASAWFYDDVMYAYQNGLMSGTELKLFSPGEHVTRGMAATVLWRLARDPGDSEGSAFTDVPSGQWYSEAIAWASETGVVSGYGDGLFGPGDNVTREQLAAMLYRYAKWAGLDVSASADLNGYTDADDISGYAADAVRWAVAVGLLEGRDNSTLAPVGTATRAELSAILRRFLAQ